MHSLTLSITWPLIHTHKIACDAILIYTLRLADNELCIIVLNISYLSINKYSQLLMLQTHHPPLVTHYERPI
jgi:hypothetical protein